MRPGARLERWWKPACVRLAWGVRPANGGAGTRHGEHAAGSAWTRTSSSCGWPRGLQPRRRVYLTALPLVAATLTRDPLPVSAVVFAEWLPWLLFGLLARALLDRWERRRVMWMVDAARLVVVGSFAAAVLAGWAAIPLLMATGFLLGTGQTLVDTASQTLVPALV